MIETKVEPALTAEEWAKRKSGPLRYGGKGSAVFIDPRDETLRAYLGGCSYEIDRRHAVAALALHGQPFGFTRERLQKHRLAVDVLRTVGSGSLADALSGDLDRIEALLPPEDK